MKVLVVANSLQQEEWFSIPYEETLLVTTVSSLEDIHPGSSYDACIDLLFDQSADRASILRKISPLTIINSVENRLTPSHQDCVRINGWNSFLQRAIVEAAVVQEDLREPAMLLFRRFGRGTKWTADMTGFITPRVVAMIINEAFFSLEERVSTEEQIDIAMKTGTNYPYGPFEWSKVIGLRQVHSLLSSLSKEHNRYQPSILLTKAVLA